MKIFAGFLSVVAVPLLLWFGRDSAWTTTLPLERSLLPGETNPEMVKVGDRWPLPVGASLWILPSRTSYATILQTDYDRILVRLGTGDVTWLERDSIRGSFIQK